MQNESVETSTKLTIIYTESNMILSKKGYPSWREIQDEYHGYKASFENWGINDVIDYLVDDYSWSREIISSKIDEFIANPSQIELILFSDFSNNHIVLSNDSKKKSFFVFWIDALKNKYW